MLRFLRSLLVSVIAILVVVTIVYAATTIGTNISTDGKITLGSASTAGGSIEVYGDASGHKVFNLDSTSNYNLTLGATGLSTAPSFSILDTSGNSLFSFDGPGQSFDLTGSTVTVVDQVPFENMKSLVQIDPLDASQDPGSKHPGVTIVGTAGYSAPSMTMMTVTPTPSPGLSLGDIPFMTLDPNTMGFSSFGSISGSVVDSTHGSITIMAASNTGSAYYTFGSSYLNSTVSIKSQTYSSDPCGSLSLPDGAMFYSSGGFYCFCFGSSAKKLHIPAEACTY